MDNDRCNLGDFNLCQESLDGSESAIAFLQRQYGPKSRSYLIGAGACPAEAAEIIDSLWADLLAPLNDRPARLQRYDGSCALQTWLNTVALNRLLTRKRTEQRWKRIISPNIESTDGDDFATSERSTTAVAESEGAVFSEAPLVEIMRIAVETASFL